MQVREHKTVNGVKVKKLFETIDMIKKNPDIAKFKFRATNKWVNGMHNRANVKDFYGAGKEDDTRKKPHIFDEDEPVVLLGEDAGANPVEYVLVALSGCLTTSLVAHAAAKGIRLDSVESKLEGDLDVRGFLGITEDVRRGYDNILVTFKIKSDATREHKTPVIVTLAT